MPDYLLYNPETNEVEGNPTLSEDQLAYNIKGGTLFAFELDAEYRSVKLIDGVLQERFDLDAVKRPLLRRIDAEALALIVDPFEAIHAAQAGEAHALDAPTPYIDAIAAETGKDRRSVAASVLARASEAERLRVAVNAKRQAAKALIGAATTLPALYQAAQVEWDA